MPDLVGHQHTTQRDRAIEIRLIVATVQRAFQTHNRTASMPLPGDVYENHYKASCHFEHTQHTPPVYYCKIHHFNQLLTPVPLFRRSGDYVAWFSILNVIILLRLLSSRPLCFVCILKSINVFNFLFRAKVTYSFWFFHLLELGFIPPQFIGKSGDSSRQFAEVHLIHQHLRSSSGEVLMKCTEEN